LFWNRKSDIINWEYNLELSIIWLLPSCACTTRPIGWEYYCWWLRRIRCRFFVTKSSSFAMWSYVPNATNYFCLTNTVQNWYTTNGQWTLAGQLYILNSEELGSGRRQYWFIGRRIDGRPIMQLLDISAVVACSQNSVCLIFYFHPSTSFVSLLAKPGC